MATTKTATTTPSLNSGGVADPSHMVMDADGNWIDASDSVDMFMLLWRANQMGVGSFIDPDNGGNGGGSPPSGPNYNPILIVYGPDDWGSDARSRMIDKFLNDTGAKARGIAIALPPVYNVFTSDAKWMANPNSPGTWYDGKKWRSHPADAGVKDATGTITDGSVVNILNPYQLIGTFGALHDIGTCFNDDLGWYQLADHWHAVIPGSGFTGSSLSGGGDTQSLRLADWRIGCYKTIRIRLQAHEVTGGRKVMKVPTSNADPYVHFAFGNENNWQNYDDWGSYAVDPVTGELIYTGTIRELSYNTFNGDKSAFPLALFTTPTWLPTAESIQHWDNNEPTVPMGTRVRIYRDAGPGIDFTQYGSPDNLGGTVFVTTRSMVVTGAGNVVESNLTLFPTGLFQMKETWVPGVGTVMTSLPMTVVENCVKTAHSSRNSRLITNPDTTDDDFIEGSPSWV